MGATSPHPQSRVLMPDTRFGSAEEAAALRPCFFVLMQQITLYLFPGYDMYVVKNHEK
jgi:hypothetical protein